MTFQEVVLGLIPIVITALLGWITPYIVKWLDAKVGHEATVALTNFAYSAVQAAEKRAGSITNSDKKLFAEAALKAFATDKKYKVTQNDLEVLIEAAVHQLKSWGPITLSGSGDTTTTSVPGSIVNVNVAAPEPAAAEETLPVTGEAEVPVAEVLPPVEEIDPQADPVLATVTPTETGAKITSIA